MFIQNPISRTDTKRRSLTARLLSGAALSMLIAGSAHADDGTLRLLSLNIWNKFKQTPALTKDFMVAGNWDVLMFQEANGSKYVSDIPGMLQNAGLGTYGGQLIGDVGLISRLPGTYGTYTAPGLTSQGRYVSYQVLDSDAGRPVTTVGTVHLDYADKADQRVKEAKALNAWAKSSANPLIISGDFNAGDVSERGLHSKSQQELLLRIYTKNSNSFYYSLLQQYAKDKAALDKFIADWSPKSDAQIDAATIPSGLFEDETYPVAGNTPQTMNVLKRQFMLLQTEREREQFKPHELNDGSVTWPSAGEDDTNTWGSWHRVKIDHFLASRPFGKWYTIADDPNDPYLGVIRDVYVTKPDGTKAPLSDHDPVAHEFKWIGPSLQTYQQTVNGAPVNKTRLVWGKDATTFAGNGKEFYLSRNNMRRDVYLGQVSDADGKPILTGLTEAEKKTLLDCKSKDPRFAQAIIDYCIDDHSFIGETLVTDGGTVIVDEDLALGGTDANLRLDNGALRITGTGMKKLDRAVVLESGGGTLDIADTVNAVVVDRAISGAGSLTKTGKGTLNLTATNTYTGDTSVRGGRLAVNGSIATSGMTTVYDGGVLGGNGTVGNLAVANGGKVAPGNSVGTLHVAGNLNLANGSVYEVEIDETGRTDQIIVTGQTVIAAGAAVNIAAGAAYKPLTNYSILTSSGGILGSFDAITSNFAFLDPGLTYGSNSLTMRLERNTTAFADVATTFNQRGAAFGVDSLGLGTTVYDAIISLDAESARSSFAQLGGEIHASTYSALLDNSEIARDSAFDRLRSRMGAADRAVTEVNIGDTSAGHAQALGIWNRSYGTWTKKDRDGNANGVDHSAGGIMVGADGTLGNDWRIGVFGGYGRTAVSIDGLASKSDTDQIDLGVYAGTYLGPIGLRFGAAHTWNNIDSARSVFLPTFSERLTAGYSASTSQVFGEISYQQSIGTVMLEPFANLAYVNFRNDAFSEHGGATALSVEGTTQQAIFTEIGLRAATEFNLQETVGTLQGSVSLRHANGDTQPETKMAFSGGSSFDVRGAPLAENVAVVNAGVNFNLGSNAALAVSYTGQFGSGASQNGINGYLGVKF
ncbi:autotransporter domain-containing protein [Rhizobium sp. CF142]|uniref:autotransporter domain-containing protein n=1 Tax=Rhizobium sp. CF142 TaxID=1144314 RepID=UPI00026EF68A|nr:autotransporter domain-containing protein [Rhizobium sp. CF142]EJJ27681.1 outer membrane autotransporter barrel domain-containing protein [Rhizobium sp. CF142]